MARSPGKQRRTISRFLDRISAGSYGLHRFAGRASHPRHRRSGGWDDRSRISDSRGAPSTDGPDRWRMVKAAEPSGCEAPKDQVGIKIRSPRAGLALHRRAGLRELGGLGMACENPTSRTRVLSGVAFRTLDPCYWLKTRLLKQHQLSTFPSKKLLATAASARPAGLRD